jgi:hypothetical protein
LQLLISVRQENERLMQESLNRAKVPINFTEPSTTSAPAAPYQTSNMLNGNFVP